MGQRFFLICQISIIVGLIFLILRSRRQPKVTKLDFSLDKNGDPARFSSQGDPRLATEMTSDATLEIAQDHAQDLVGGRRLQIYFNFNGETFDADEILGVPAGASPQQAQQAFQDQFSHLDAKDRLIFEMALKSIQQRRKN